MTLYVVKVTKSEHVKLSEKFHHAKPDIYGVWVISWYFEPGQLQWITSGLKQNSICRFFLHTSWWLVIKSVMTQIYIKQSIHTYQTQNFQRICPFNIAPVKKAHKARTRWYRGPFCQIINTRFSTKYENGMLVISLVFWAKSTTKDYITTKINVKSVSYLLCMQVIKPQIIPKPQNQSWRKLT